MIKGTFEDKVYLNIQLPNIISSLVKEISNKNGTAYLVGGAVIDRIYNRPIKDWDIEVFNLSYQQLLDLTTNFGKTNLIGQKFGVVKLKKDGIDVELSIPRKDSKIGPKHKDFNVELTPNLTLAEAAERRDLTINTIYLNLHDMKVSDPCGGRRCLRKGIIDAVNPNTFKEDPLRVFRVMQLVARKGRVVTFDTKQLCYSMKEDCKHLSSDSIYGEFVKMLMLSDHPERGLNFLDESNIIELFPELDALRGSKQNPKHHPEGDVFLHTQLVLREAAKYRDELPEEWRLPFMFGMMLHDVGKPATLDPIKLTNYGHEKAGKELTRSFMERLTNNQKLINQIVSIVYGHMRPISLIKDYSKEAAWRRLQNICPLNIMAYVAICDQDGRRLGIERLGKENPEFSKIMDAHKDLGEPKAKIKPILQGRHLIEAGYTPGPSFNSFLETAYTYQINTGCSDIQKLLQQISPG